MDRHLVVTVLFAFSAAFKKSSLPPASFFAQTAPSARSAYRNSLLLHAVVLLFFADVDKAVGRRNRRRHALGSCRANDRPCPAVLLDLVDPALFASGAQHQYIRFSARAGAGRGTWRRHRQPCGNLAHKLGRRSVRARGLRLCPGFVCPAKRGAKGEKSGNRSREKTEITCVTHNTR